VSAYPTANALVCVKNTGDLLQITLCYAIIQNYGVRLLYCTFNDNANLRQDIMYVSSLKHIFIMESERKFVLQCM